MLKLKTQGEEERIEVRKMTRFDLTTYIHNRELLVNTEYIFSLYYSKVLFYDEPYTYMHTQVNLGESLN